VEINDIIEYQNIAVQSLLEFCAQNKKTILLNYLLENSENIQNGKKYRLSHLPFRKISGTSQKQQHFVDKMTDHGIRVYKLKKPVTLESRLYPEDTWIIPLDQPYRPFILAMLNSVLSRNS